MGPCKERELCNVAKKIENEVVQALLKKEDEVDSELKKLENVQEDELERLYIQRFASLKQKAACLEKLREIGHGVYNEVTEKDFFQAAKQSRFLVIHFFRPSTSRCVILDKHLAILAEQYMSTRFLKINAEKAPFLTERLKIHIIPTIVVVKDRSTIATLVGFEAFGGTDYFTTQKVEAVLKNLDVLDKSLKKCFNSHHENDETLSS